MRTLIIAATKNEVHGFLNSDIQKSSQIDVLITGVGMVATAYSITKKLNETTYDLLLNVGIAGSFHPSIPLGAVVRVKKDCFCELGAENDEEFLTIKDLNFGESYFDENCEALTGLLSMKSLHLVEGITVNKVHGNKNSIKKVAKQFSPDVESMEGAAVFYVAKHENILSMQIRAISNFVEKRNKDKWDIPLAIKNLNDWLIQFITELSYTKQK